jgi:glycosyltransferase involved in cell wall biosynthesis
VPIEAFIPVMVGFARTWALLFFWLAVVRERTKKFAEAASAYEAAVARDDSNAEWHYRLGFLRERMEKYAEAASAYEAAMARDDSNAEWHYRLGLVRERTEKYAEAASAYEAAVARDDGNAEWHYRLGLLREWLIIRPNLWSCFAQHAVTELERLRAEAALTLEQVGAGAWALAGYYISSGQGKQALQSLELARSVPTKEVPEELSLLLEIEALLLLGRAEEANAAVRCGLKTYGETPHLCFAAANTITSEASITRVERDRLRLEWINKCFLRNGFPPLELRDSGRVLTFDNLVAAATPWHDHKGSAKLTVIVPAYNAAGTIVTALDSILRQTWSNLEVLVVDDGSTDHTWSIIRLVAETDTRIVCLRHEENRGAYAARNTALRHATGEFITVHDADNWSHPQKFAVQLVDLLESGAAFNTTAYLGVGWQMKVETRSWNPPDMLRESFPSLTFKRKDAIALGGWDEVRMGADDEMYDRLMALHRAGRRKLFADAPLSFNLLSKRNLTNQKFTGLRSLSYGARREYREAFRYWHSVEEANAQPKLVMAHHARPFPAPSICRNEPSETLLYDVLLVSDYSLVGGAASSNIEVISAANRQGLRVACFHWPLFDNALSPLNPDVRALVHQRAVDCVVAGESINCDLVIVVQPAILHCVPDLLPRIQTHACVIRAKGVFKYDLHRVIETAQGIFNVEPEMAPPTALFECPRLAAGLSNRRGQRAVSVGENVNI